MRYSSLASRVGVMILRRLHLHGNTTTLKGGHHEWGGICDLDENYLLVCFGMQETMGNSKQMSAKPFSETQDIIFNIIMVFKILTSLPHWHCYNALFRAHYHHDNKTWCFGHHRQHGAPHCRAQPDQPRWLRKTTCNKWVIVIIIVNLCRDIEHNSDYKSWHNM